MASGDVKNNVSGKPKKSIGKGYSSGTGMNNDAFVRNSQGGAPRDGTYGRGGGGGDQNEGYGAAIKRPLKQDPANRLSSVSMSRAETSLANYKPNKVTP